MSGPTGTPNPQTSKILQIFRNELTWTWRISGGYMKADILRNLGNQFFSTKRSHFLTSARRGTWVLWHLSAQQNPCWPVSLVPGIHFKVHTNQHPGPSHLLPPLRSLQLRASLPSYSLITLLSSLCSLCAAPASLAKFSLVSVPCYSLSLTESPTMSSLLLSLSDLDSSGCLWLFPISSAIKTFSLTIPWSGHAISLYNVVIDVCLLPHTWEMEDRVQVDFHSQGV